MNNIILAFTITFLAGISTVIGGMIIFLKFKDYHKLTAFCLSFSMSIMLLISVVELFPTSFVNLTNALGFIKSFVLVIVNFSIGIVVITLLNRKINDDSTKSIDGSISLYKLGVLNAFALMFHNFPEGVATFMASVDDITIGLSLGIAILMHNIPEGISIAVPIYNSTNNKTKAILFTLVSGLAEPLGALVAYMFLFKYINDITISLILIMVCGIMITLAINKLFPEVIKYKKYKEVYYGIIVALIIIILLQLIH